MNGENSKLSPREIILLKEYELSQMMLLARGQNMWQIASILLGGGLAAIALVVSRIKPPNLMAAIVCFAIVIFEILFYYKVKRSNKIAEIHYRRCCARARELSPLSGAR